jgi:ribosomal protein S18 acetylase RimI-like enzyme
MLLLAFSADVPGLALDGLLQNERVARYAVDWGRPGDGGVVADVDGNGVGAAWYRQFPQNDPGYGFVSKDIPELSIAVLPEMRGRGIGRSLLFGLIEQARAAGLPALSLSVSAGNLAGIRLYESVGFRPVAGDPTHPTMLIRISTSAPST